MWRVVLVSSFVVACFDPTITKPPPYQCRLDAKGFPVELDETDHGCIGPVPEYCGSVDLDRQTPGVQYGCDVSDIQNLGQPDQRDHVILPCNESATRVPCWRVVSDEQCPEDDRAALEVHRDGIAAPDGSIPVVECYCGSCP